jgi:catechol 2,3-dioxygenase-like lactoylglutathione lyase family enzyme
MLNNQPIVCFVPTTDAVRCRAFYEHILGLEFVAEDSFAVSMRANGVRLRLTRLEEFKPAPFTILGWGVPDISKMADAFAARGVAFEQFGLPGQDARGIWNAPGGARVAWFKDPDGNTLSITQFS